MTTAHIPIEVICRDFNGQLIIQNHTVKVTDHPSGRPIPTTKGKHGSWEFQIPETGVSMLRVEAWGKDGFGGFFPIHVFLSVDSTGRIALVPRRGDSSFVELFSDPQSGGTQFTLKMILGRLRERPLDDFSGDRRKSIHILRDHNQVDNTWVLEYADADLITTNVLFDVNVNTQPKWLAVSFPSDWKAFDRLLVYFHPVPGQNEHHRDMVRAHGYPDGLADLVRGYTIGNRVNLAYQLSASGRRTMLVLPVLWGRGIGVLANPTLAKSLFVELCHRLKDRVREVHGVERIAQMAVASFSNGAGYRSAFMAVARSFPLSDVFDFDGTAAGGRLGGLGAGIGRLIYDESAADPHSIHWKNDAKAGVFHLPETRWDNIRPKHDDDAHHYIAKYMLLHALMRSRFPR